MYIFNGVAHLRELKEVSLNGANLFFNGSFRVEDLQDVDLRGANVFLNGQLQVSSSMLSGKRANGWQPMTKTETSADATMSTASPTAVKVCPQVAAASRNGRQDNPSPVKSAIRASPKVSDSGETESLASVADELGKLTKIDHQNQRSAEFLTSTSKDLSSKDNESTTTSSKPLPRNPNHTPLGLNRNVASGHQTRTSDTTSDHFKQPARPVRYSAPAVVATHVLNRPAKNTPCSSPGDRGAESLSEAVHKSASSNSLATRGWTHDVADDSVKLTPQKRISAPDILSTSKNANKKPRLETCDGFDLDKQTEKLIQEEIQRGKRARQFSDSGNGHNATAEFEKIRTLSYQRKEIRSQLLGQPHRPLATHSTAFRSSRDRPLGRGSHQMPILPQDSPLNNVINSAMLHEQIVQAKLKFNLAQKQLLEEKRRGTASRAISARVRAWNETLAALNKKRKEIWKDVDRMDSFRRCDLRGYGRDAGDLTRTTPPSPPPSLTDSDWKNRLTLCYEGLERAKPRHEAGKNMKRESATLSVEEETMIKQEASDQNSLWRVGEAGDRVSATVQRRQVRFALTDVETYL